MRISDWSADVCSSDLAGQGGVGLLRLQQLAQDHVALQRCQVVDEENAVEMIHLMLDAGRQQPFRRQLADFVLAVEEAHADLRRARSEEHTSELQSLMRNSYAVLCLKKKKYKK